MAEHEVLFRLGDLLTHAVPERRTAAAEHFRRALDLEAGHGPSWAGLGYLAELAGAHEEAREHYEKAVTLPPDAFLAQYLYGESLLRALGDKRPESIEERALLGRAQDAFRRAVTLREDFGPAWARLGYSYGLEPGPSRAGVEALQTAMLLLPGDKSVNSNLLLAYARTGNREGVEAMRARLEALGADPPELERAREILLRMDLQKANELARQNKLDDAVALYVQIQAETSDPAVAQQATANLSMMVKAEQANDYIAAYNEAVHLLRAGDNVAVAGVIAELTAAAEPGWQREVLRVLRDKLVALQTGMGTRRE